MSAINQTDDWFSEGLDSFITSGELRHTAAPAECIGTDSEFDFLRFLGMAQSLNVDFLPITWQPGLDSFGRGGTAEIRQAQVNLEMSFAFKSLASKGPVESETHEARKYRALTAETLVLRHPSIRSHQNIIRLEGICWEVASNGDKVWPVLVFEKARHGDLQKFMELAEGKSLTLEQRLEICADIATAVMEMHSNSIIHGDIKPENVLIFENSPNNYVVKVADFGYSTWFARDTDLVKMPRSQYWVAPEWHHRGFSRAAAVKMDIYSFGMLCLWLLCFKSQENTDNDFYGYLASARTLVDLAHEAITAMIGLEEQKRRDLSQLFDLTLAKKPAERSSNFNQLIPLCIPLRNPAIHTPAAIVIPPHLLTEDFQVLKSIHQIYMAQYEVRAYIALCLKKREIGPSCHNSRKAALELAFCYKLGFGIAKDDERSEALLNKHMVDCEELENKVNLLKMVDQDGQYQDFRGSAYSRLESQGHILKIPIVQYYREQQRLDKIELEYRREIMDLKSELGAEYPIVLYLESILASIFRATGRFVEAEELFRHLMETSLDLFGAENASTLYSMGNLALIWKDQGRWIEAEALEVKVLCATRALGTERLDTLEAMATLASTYKHLGRWKESDALKNQAMDGSMKILGADHPFTLTSMANLASSFRDQGRLEEAEHLEVRTLETRKRVLGVEHPDTLASMTNLAATYSNQKRWKEAEAIEMEVVEISSRVLGEEHPSTMGRINNLAVTFSEQGRWTEAENCEEKVVRIYLKTLGLEHPSTLTSIANLAGTYKDQGRLEEAVELQAHVMNVRKRVLGPAHFSTLIIMNNLAVTYEKSGRWKEAEELLEHVIEKRGWY